MEAWLASIDPVLMDRWLAVQRACPEIFGGESREQQGGGELMDARVAAAKMKASMKL